MCLRILALIFFFVFCQLTAYSQPENLELFKDFPLVREKGKTLIEIGLGDLLRLSLRVGSMAEILKINRQIAEDDLRAAQAALNPILAASFQLDRRISPFLWKGALESSDSQGESPAVLFSANDAGVFSATWSKKTYSGIVYGLSYRKLYTNAAFGYMEDWGKDFSGWTSPAESIYTDSLAFSIQAPIFQDWGDVNKMPEYKSRTALKQTNAESQKTKLEFIKMVSDIYWDMAGILENIKVLEAGARLSEQLVRDAKVQSELGVLDSIEVKQAESRLAMARQNLLREITTKKLLEDRIKMLLNIEEFPLGYKLPAKLFCKKRDFNFDYLLLKIYQNSQELELLRTALEMNRLNLKEARNKAKTDIDLNVQYQLNSYDNSTRSSGRFNRTGLHDYKLGLTWKAPLFDRITPQRIKKLTLEKHRLNIQLDDKKSELKTELRAVFRNLDLLRKGIELAQISLSLVESLFDKESERYKAGKSTAFRVSQTQRDLTDARKDEIVAKVRYEKTFLSLLILTEQVFSYYKL